MTFPRVVIDEHGRLFRSEQRVSDPQLVREFYNNLQLDLDFKLFSEVQGQKYLVEAFDAPWVIYDLKFDGDSLRGVNTDGVETNLNLETCSFDDWDRMGGLTEHGLPWVLNRNCQEKIFSLFDSYDDESFTLKGKTYEVRPDYTFDPAIVSDQFWSQRYTQGQTGWDLNSPHPALIDMHPRLKLPRSRVLVLGCGAGHDAAYFAREGHVVTAVDFSTEALKKAENNYGNLGIEFVQKDVFNLPSNYTKSFDFVLEHTLYCAVPPERRKDLVQVWNRCLVPGGYFMGIFFTMEKKSGPPFGSREWEIRQRLKKSYHILFWGRWQSSPGWRDGLELFVMGQKKDL